MLMSHAAIRSAGAGCPNAGFGDDVTGVIVGAVPQAGISMAATRTATVLRVYIFHAPVGADRPADDRIVVETNVRREQRRPLTASGLHVALFIGRAALQHRV